MNKIYKCFISSTFQDLKDERRRVIEAVLDARQLPAGMENFNASDKSQWDYIKLMLEDCDYFIVIIAHRYGSTDEGGMSYTEKEVRYALEKDIPVLTFIIDGSAEWPHSGYEDDPANKIRLEQFKKYLSTDRMVKHWSDKNDLAAKVTSALHEAIRDHPRPGYIRGDLTDKQTEAHAAPRQPKFDIKFDESTEVKINFSCGRNVNPLPLLERVEELSYGQPIDLSVSDDEVDNWNQAVSEYNDKIGEYNDKASEYNKGASSVAISFSISNIGTQRANNILVVMEFPEWIVAYDSDDMPEKPRTPDIPVNPVRAASNRLKATSRWKTQIASVPPLSHFARSLAEPSFMRIPDIDYLTGEPRRFLVVGAEHSVEYHADTLQHGSRLVCDKLRLLPVEKEPKAGMVKLACHCDELPEPQIIEIPVSTELL